MFARKESPTMPKSEIQILLLVSHAIVQHRLTLALHDRYRLKFEANLTKGLAKAYSSVPDIIILHSEQPQEQLSLICRRLKEHQTTSHIPIIQVLSDVSAATAPSVSAPAAILPFDFSSKDFINALQYILSLKIQLMQRYPMFYNSDNAFVREQVYLDQYIKQLPE